MILSSVPEKEYVLRALRYGASGCLHKSLTSEELIDAVLSVKKKGRWISDRVKDVLLDNVYSSKGEDPRDDLSDREFQVIMLLAKGKTLKSISDDLNLSIKTVSTYKTRIMIKLGLENNSQLFKYD